MFVDCTDKRQSLFNISLSNNLHFFVSNCMRFVYKSSRSNCIVSCVGDRQPSSRALSRLPLITIAR